MRLTVEWLESRHLPSSFSLVSAGGSGDSPWVRLPSRSESESERTFTAYDENFTGGVNVGTADFNRDGILDVVTGPGPGGGPRVRVFDGATGLPLAGPLGDFFAFDSGLRGGVNVAADDFTGDGIAELVVGAGVGGGPHVRILDGATGKELQSFFAFDPAFTGGVTVATGDVTGDGLPDLIAGAGPGGGPHVRVFDGVTGTEVASFFAFDPAFTNGMSLAAGDLDGDARAEIIVGAGVGGGPHVRVFDGDTGKELQSFFAFDESFRGGVRVAVLDADADIWLDIVASPASGDVSEARAFSGRSGALLGSVEHAGGSIAPADNSRWDWIGNTQWYVPAENLLAYLAGLPTDPVPLADQTLWTFGPAQNGHFSGDTTVQLSIRSPVGLLQPDPMHMTHEGFVTPAGNIRITFYSADPDAPPTTGIGNMRFVNGTWSMEMQMASGPGPYLTHWAYMLPLTPEVTAPAALEANISPELRSEEWRWLFGTNWALADSALVGPSAFHIEGFRNGYFWGSGPGVEVTGSVTPEGGVFLTVLADGQPLINRTGVLRQSGGEWTMVVRSYTGEPEFGLARLLSD